MPNLIDRRTFLTQIAACSGALALGLPPRPAAATPSLQQQVNDLVQRMRAQGRISASERTSWSVYDFSTRQKLVSINEEIPRQAASMMKPFVALALFYLADTPGSGLRYTPQIRATMEQMLRRSSNPATTELMRLVSQHGGNQGPRSTDIVLKRHAPGIFRETSIVEYIPDSGRTYLNLASARDYSRFLYALWHDQLPRAAELRDLMSLPKHNRIVRGVSNIPATVRVYDKSGSTAMLCGNMGIIECQAPGRRHAYTFIGIIERPTRTDSYTTWITARSNAIRNVSGLVYEHMKTQHRLV